MPRKKAAAKKDAGVQSYVKQITALSKVASMIASGTYLDELLRLIVQVTAEAMDLKISSLMLLDEEKKELVVKATQSVSEAYNKKPNIRIGEGIAGRVVTENRPITVLDIRKDPQYVNSAIAKKEGLISLACIPLTVRGRVIGVLNCYTSHEHVFSPHEMEILRVLANQAAVAIENAELALRARSAEEALMTRKLVERAKEILALEASMSPQEAYRLIQKQSMDTRKSMRDIAEAIILSHELKSKK